MANYKGLSVIENVILLIIRLTFINAFTLAPANSKVLTIFTWPPWHATKSAVPPSYITTKIKKTKQKPNLIIEFHVQFYFNLRCTYHGSTINKCPRFEQNFCYINISSLRSKKQCSCSCYTFSIHISSLLQQFNHTIYVTTSTCKYQWCS